MNDYIWNRSIAYGQVHLECVDCQFDTLGESAENLMQAHCKISGHGRSADLISTEEYIAANSRTEPLGVIITLGYLCWNTRDVSVEGVRALCREYHALVRLGNIPHIVVVDNGSSDGTFEAITQLLHTQSVSSWVIRLVNNQGISVARNRIIDKATSLGSKYLLFMDGDIGIVYLSSYAMMRYLECHWDVGCIGAYAANWTDKRWETTRHLIEIPESRVRSDIRCAWTQYGLFRCCMFDSGIRFDETGPLGQPGWGFEDDDLYYQMVTAGWKNKYFGGMRYLHRALHSSWPELKCMGVSVEDMFHSRRDYLVDKWAKRGLDTGILNMLKAQSLPGI